MSTEDTLDKKHARLREMLRAYDAVAVAFSGGVDSTLLLAEAGKTIGETVIALTAVSALQPRWEVDEAIRLARILGITHELIHTRELSDPAFTVNSPDRCYVCKKTLFSEMIARSRELGYAHMIHGANADDLADYRPGMRAAEELSVTAPLKDAGLTKADIRALARQMELPNWNKPAAACLASRLPYGMEITPGRLKMVEEAENVLMALGFTGFRVRHLGDTARIEVMPADFSRLIHPERRLTIIRELRDMGFVYVTLDLEGYTAGRMNRSIGT